MRYISVLVALGILAATLTLVSFDRPGRLIADHSVSAPKFSPEPATAPAPL
jgi:hypothetical protein